MPKSRARSFGGGGKIDLGAILGAVYGSPELITEQGDLDYTDAVPLEETGPRYQKATAGQRAFNPGRVAETEEANAGWAQQKLLTKGNQAFAEKQMLANQGFTANQNILQDERALQRAYAVAGVNEDAAREAFVRDAEEARKRLKAVQDAKLADEVRAGGDADRAWLAAGGQDFGVSPIIPYAPVTRPAGDISRAAQVWGGQRLNQEGLAQYPSLVSKNLAVNARERADALNAESQSKVRSDLETSKLRLANKNAEVLHGSGVIRDEFGNFNQSFSSPIPFDNKIEPSIGTDPITKKQFLIPGRTERGTLGATVTNLLEGTGVTGSGSRKVGNIPNPDAALAKSPPPSQVLTKPTRGELEAEQEMVRSQAPGFGTQIKQFGKTLLTDPALVDFSARMSETMAPTIQADMELTQRNKRVMDWLKEQKNKYILTK